ncbi:hypothetical protein [Pseudomonas sp.]|uniref:hypothetical protein n=1 Tax=Pseudomonas sp. TaxID=306 RepID=UPI003D701E45
MDGKNIIPVPYVFTIITMAPIFLIAFLLPENPDSDIYREINSFLDGHLLGQVGYWSSKFPFSSKVVANYISILGPVFALIFFVKVYQGLIVDPEQYKKHTVIKYFFAAIGMIGLISFVIYINYFGSVDLGAHSRKWRFFGSNAFAYSLFSSGMLFGLYGMTIFSYAGFFYLPRLLIKRWRDK